MKWDRKMEQELERDLADHIAQETEDNMARGMSPVEARRAALLKFGNPALIKEDTRSVWTWTTLETLWGDVHHAFRKMRRAPGTAALVVLSLVVAFIPSVTVFSIMDRLFLTPLQVRNPEEILQIIFRDQRPNAVHPYQMVSYPEFQELRTSLKSFSGLAYESGKPMVVSLAGGNTIVVGALVSHDYFSVLGVPIQLGLGFSKQRPSVVISETLWKREFAGRTDIIGRPLLIYGKTFTVDGIAASDFHTDHLRTEAWIPVETWLQQEPAFRAEIEQRDVRAGQVWARMRSGLTGAQAAAEVESVTRDMARRWPVTNRYLVGFAYARLAELKRGGILVTSIALLLLGIVVAVACTNIAGILLTRAEERRHETAVRQALGASRARLVREWMVESAVLSLVAAALGMAGARVLIYRLPAWVPSIQGISLHFDFSFGPRVWLYALALVSISAISFGIVPAWRGSRPDLVSGLRRDTAVTVFRVRVPIRSMLIVAQVAAAEVLLFGAGLVLDTLVAARRVDPGFDPSRPVAMATLLGTGENGKVLPLDCEAIRERLARIGGVRRVTYGHAVPLAGFMGSTLRLDVPGQAPRQVLGSAAGPGFLSTLGVRMLSGRDLQDSDQHAILVNATLARSLDVTGSPVGRQIRIEGAVLHIVGVFQDTSWGFINDAPQPRVIYLTPAHAGGDTTFAVEVAGDPEAFVPTLHKELAAAQPGGMVLSPKTLRRHYQEALVVQRSATQFLYGLAFLAILLTVAGLHGISAALFARRSREFAIRLALGAAPRHIMGTVLGSGLKLALGGLISGIGIALPIAILIASRVEGVSAWSLAALGLSSVVVLLAALVAATQPALRVFRIHPADIVRVE